MVVRLDHNSIARAMWERAWARPEGRWPWARWGLALLIPVAGLLWLLSVMFAPDDPDVTRIVIQSQATSEGIEGARVSVGDVLYLTDAEGEILIPRVANDTPVQVSAAGHESTEQFVEDDELVVSLNVVLVLGSLTDIVSGEPIADADIVINDANGEEVATSRTDESGTFVFKFIPEDAEIVVRHDVYGEHRQDLGARRSIMIQLQPPDVRGRVVDGSGVPVADALISGPQVTLQTDQDGQFLLQGVGQGTELVVGSGKGRTTVEVRGDDLGDIKLSDTSATPAASPEGGEGP